MLLVNIEEVPKNGLSGSLQYAFNAAPVLHFSVRLRVFHRERLTSRSVSSNDRIHKCAFCKEIHHKTSGKTKHSIATLVTQRR